MLIVMIIGIHFRIVPPSTTSRLPKLFLLLGFGERFILEERPESLVVLTGNQKVDLWGPRVDHLDWMVPLFLKLPPELLAQIRSHAVFYQSFIDS